MNLPLFSAKHRVTVSMAVCAVLLLGFVSLKRLGTDLLPDLDTPRIVVALESSGKSPREMEDTYAERLEGQLGTVRHVRRVQSVSYVGRIVVTAEFAWHTDMDFALLEVNKQMAAYSGAREIDNVVVARFDPRQLPVLTFGVAGLPGQDLDELRRIGEDTIKRRLEGLDGVAAARVSGGRERQVVIEPDPYLLKAYGLSFGELRQLIQAANVDASGGQIEDNERSYVVHAMGEFKGLDDIREVAVGYRTPGAMGEQTSETEFAVQKVPVKLSEVASVRYAYKEVHSAVRLNGEECVGVSVYKEADENTVRVVDMVRKELARIERDVPELRIVVADDQARFIKIALREVYQTTAYGVLLAIVVLYVFLRNFRTTLIVCLAFPISIIATFNLMYFSELTLNIMTLGGLALGAGMLVDSAIVVVENIFRHRQMGKPIFESAVDGTAEVGGAITAATITTVVVFLPIVFVRGMAGELFKEQAMTVAFSLLSSLLVALLVIPAAASKYLTIKEKDLGKVGRHPVFAALVGQCVDHKFLVVILAMALGGTAAYLLPKVGSEFVPTGDEGQFIIEMRLPEGTRIETTEEYVRQAEGIIKATAGDTVSTVFARIGQTKDEMAVLEEEVSGDNTAKISVVLAGHPIPEGRVGEWADRLGLLDLAAAAEKRPGSEALVGAIDPLLRALPGLKVHYVLHESTLQQSIGTGEAPIVLRLRGPNLETLRRLTREAATRMAGVPELYNVRTSFEGGHPEVEVLLDRPLAASFGLDTEQVAAVVREKVDGEVVGDFVAEDEQRDIEMKFAEMALHELPGIEIENPQGALLTLADIAELNVTEGPRTIERHEQQRAGVVMASPAEGIAFSDAVAAMGGALEGFAVPPHYRLDVAGEEAQRAESFRTLQLAMLLAIALVYMVLAGQFESLIHPFVILLTVPLAGIGVVFAFYLLERPFNVMAYIGAIMLAGIAVNDSIVLVDFINQVRRRGVGRREAILEAVQTRLRPIVMTSLTTILVLLPLSLGIGESARLRAPMAITVIAGLCASTVLTLFVIPAVYALLDGLKRTP
jgi:hydrophobic/amphiphilic exporter-1 (mainly G- bacteria), HAE1 family